MSPATPPADAGANADGPPRPAWLVTPLDPVSAVLARSLPYPAAPIDLPDEQPLPGLRVLRDPREDGSTLTLLHHLGEERLATDRLRLERLPLDPATPPRRRIRPAWVTVLTVTSDPDAARGHLEVGEEESGTRVRLAATGPSPADLDRVVELAADHRYVHIPAPLAGDLVLAAALVLRLAAASIPVVAPAEVAAAWTLLDPELRAAVAVTPASLEGDDLALARAAADQRRAAWRHHHLRLEWAPTPATAPDGAPTWSPQLRPPRRPSLSVILATRRPELLPAALAMVAAQQGVDTEVVVALHGAGDPDTAAAELARHGLDGRVLPVPARVPFGAALQAAVQASHGELVTKWDDDDLYGPDHLADLVIAQHQTGAALTGRAPEFVYLQASGTTVWRTPGRAEAHSMGIAGGTFLLPRAALEDVGGFPPVARAVDHHLKVAVKAAGGLVFRTHGFGFVLRRHAAGHTWESDDERFLASAVRTFEGIPDVVGLGPAAGFAHLPALTGGEVSR